MPLLDPQTLKRFGDQGESQFASERPCIIDRVSIALTSGLAKYTLPAYVNSIRRMTYLGWKVYPMPHRDLRQSYLSGTQQSRPYWYIFNNIGQAQIQLFPVPSQNIPLVADPWALGIPFGFIIEFFRQPDPGNASFQLPTWMRRRYLKTYINYRFFSMEGRGNNMKAAKYWKSQFDMRKELYTNLMDDLNNKPRNLVASDSAQRPYGFTPPPPILPVDRYGISVDEPSW